MLAKPRLLRCCAILLLLFSLWKVRLFFDLRTILPSCKACAAVVCTISLQLRRAERGLLQSANSSKAKCKRSFNLLASIRLSLRREREPNVTRVLLRAWPRVSEPYRGGRATPDGRNDPTRQTGVRPRACTPKAQYQGSRPRCARVGAQQPVRTQTLGGSWHPPHQPDCPTEAEMRSALQLRRSILCKSRALIARNRQKHLLFC